ncbi:hypothetical protein QWY77_00560 [Thalassotalea ponticola]|uniref:hypothetical protein n=1 Tax=Thalassotalea ponticola TaxID=1523392 RepID=UPI0025B5BE82|nr:hypothetical protein [Thalassotalea ponticola]MDN3651275.1 hypothetical protein [Thalassotalea ponticola]
MTVNSKVITTLLTPDCKTQSLPITELNEQQCIDVVGGNTDGVHVVKDSTLDTSQLDDLGKLSQDMRGRD